MKTILVTGASSGIGKALCLQLAAEGHTVYAAVRNLKKGRAELKGAPKNLKLIELDVTKPAHTNRTLKEIQKAAGQLDVLVNNAGYGVYGPTEELGEKGIREQFETNFFGAVRLTNAVLPLFREQKSGLIVQVSSILGKLALPTGSAYTSSKWALEAYSESLRYEMFPFNVKVTLVEPGLIRTKFKENMNTIKKAPHYEFLHRLVQGDYRSFNTSAEKAGDAIAKIIEKKNPAQRYLIGLDAKLSSMLRRIVPDFFMDLLIKGVVKRSYRQIAASETTISIKAKATSPKQKSRVKK